MKTQTGLTQPICKKCGKNIPLAVVFNTTPLTLVEYNTLVTFRGKRQWCLDCTKKEIKKKNLIDKIIRDIGGFDIHSYEKCGVSGIFLLSNDIMEYLIRLKKKEKD